MARKILSTEGTANWKFFISQWSTEVIYSYIMGRIRPILEDVYALIAFMSGDTHAVGIVPEEENKEKL